MNFNDFNINGKLVPANYLKLAQDAQKSKEIDVQELLSKRKIPENGWTDAQIEELCLQLSALDSNNFSKKLGLGEREARIACKLVARRHYNFGHGIGRSGSLMDAQPKAAGSTLLANLTNELMLDLIREVGVRSCRSCFLVPMATGMTLTLCLLSLKKKRPDAKYVLWSRIDQKSCFKCITSACLCPVIIDSKLNSDNGELTTDIEAFKRNIETLPKNKILCILSTTSCFAPRNCDDIATLSQLAAEHDLPHLVNNAYGLQSTLITHQLEQAQRKGRVDLFVQSTDKNLMVPVGGAVVAGFDETIVQAVAKTYAGRASSTPTFDVFITLLSMGKSGYRQLLLERKTHFEYLREKLKEFVNNHNAAVINTKQNQISCALTLDSLKNASSNNLNAFGAMLYTRGVSGVRVVDIGATESIDGYVFKNWGTHHADTKSPYLTVAASLGITMAEIDKFFEKLEDCWKHFSKTSSN